jgi:iron(III) transport system ATP-binding protein
MNVPQPDLANGSKWGARGTAGAAFPARLAIENVTHRFGARTVLSNVSFDVQAGEVVALLGQSGCGKSTLLRIIAGVERQSEGQIYLDKRCMASAKDFVPPEKRGIGLMFQDYALFPHLSILDNAAFGLRALPRKDAVRIAQAAISRVGLEHHAFHHPHALSGGEQQRAALARAVAPRPGVLLMDEPFSGLDRRLRDDVRDETLTVLRETNATSIVVTHDPEEAMRMADRIVLMRQGRIVQIGTPVELYQRPNSLFTAKFFSEMNEVPASVKDGVASSPLGKFSAPGVPDGRAVVAIRHTGLKILPKGKGVAARVQACRFLGEVFTLDLAVEGLDHLLKGRMRGAMVEARTEIGLGVDPQEVLVFPKAEA